MKKAALFFDIDGTILSEEQKNSQECDRGASGSEEKRTSVVY